MTFRGSLVEAQLILGVFRYGIAVHHVQNHVVGEVELAGQHYLTEIGFAELATTFGARGNVLEFAGHDVAAGRIQGYFGRQDVFIRIPELREIVVGSDIGFQVGCQHVQGEFHRVGRTELHGSGQAQTLLITVEGVHTRQARRPHVIQ